MDEHEHEHEHVPMGDNNPEEQNISETPSEEGKDHRILWIVVAFFALLMVLGVVAFNKYSTPAEPEVVQQPENIIPSMVDNSEVCDYANDGAAYASAVNTSSEYPCRCIQDVDKKDMCTTAVKDGQLYNNAITQLNGELCDEISTQSTKEQCVDMVAVSMEYFEENDPGYIAEAHKRARSDEAIGVYEELVKEDSGDLNSLIALTLAYAEKGLKEQEQGRDQTPYVEKALATIEKAKALEEHELDVKRAEAYVYEIQPDYYKALALYDEVLAVDPEHILALAGKGHVERMLGLFDLALEDFEKAAELDTENEQAYIYTNLCNMNSSRGNYEDAETYCLIVAESDTFDAVSKSNTLQILAKMAFENGELSKANSYLSEAKTLTPNDANLYVTYAKLNIFEAKYSTSEENARKAIELVPTKAAAYLSLSQALYMQDKYEESIGAAEKGLTLVELDVSLLDPAKPAVERDLYYMIANNYRQTADTANEEKYLGLAKEIDDREFSKEENQ